MTTHDELISRFDALDADLGKLLNHYRKVKRDRKALLEAAKSFNLTVPSATAPCHFGMCHQDECGHCQRIKALLSAIAAAESEE